MARPKKDDAEKRDKRLPDTRVTLAELATVKAKAAQAGLTMSAYMRQMALHGQVMEREPVADKEFIFELKAQGRNFNQYQKKLNALHIHEPQEVRRIIKKIEDMLDALL